MAAEPGRELPKTAAMAAAKPPPVLPPGRELELPGRGKLFVRELWGPPGAPVLFLLHGWTATADLNWCTSYAALGRRFRVIAPDLRGHGRGLRTRKPFQLRDCADDVAAIADVLGIDRFLVAGYSMGGPIAQLTWKRHRSRVAGLVLCATARNFTSGVPEERLWFVSLNGLALASRLGPGPARRWLSEQFMHHRGREYEPWAFDQVRGHDWTAVFEAGRSLGRFSSVPWAGEINVPTAVVVTTKDRVVPVRRQIRLAESIPFARLFPVEGDHDVCVARPELFVPTLVAAATWTAERDRLGDLADLAHDGRANRSA
jgi:pimeloyl-ACP methyl ester carboxylesterase